MSISRSIGIDAPVTRVFGEVRDFQSWPKWSPWLIADPDCSLDFGKDRYSWAGAVCGAGGMAVIGEKENEWISYDLVFQKPFKSVAKVRMIFAEKEGGTLVTWTMDSSLPFFLFWLTKSMEGFIGMDNQRGLMMLKALVETGEVPSKLEFPGPETVPPMTGVGVRRTCGFDEMPEKIGGDFRRVRREFPGGRGFNICYEWKVSAGTLHYLIGVEVESVPTDLAPDLEVVTIPRQQVYVVRHTGPYQFLGNAWAAGMMHSRSGQFSQSRKLPPFELYADEDSENPMVKICLPMK